MVVAEMGLIAWLLRLWLTILTIDSLRYLIPVSAAFLIFLVFGRDRFAGRLVQGRFPRAERMFHDFRWSMSTVLIFSLFGVAVRCLGNAGILRRYDAIATYGWPYFVVSVLVLLVLQDTYFYWTHRLMHHPLLYRRFHRTHHVSTNPSPWSAYAFAPPEAAVHAVFVPIVWLVMPLHQLAVFAFLVMMILRNVLGHLSIELFPSGFARGLTGWSTTTTHHNLHHQHFSSNFGLYFTFWDRMMGTTHPRYEQTFERVVSK